MDIFDTILQKIHIDSSFQKIAIEKKDPLNSSQMDKIKAFVDYFLLNEEKKAKCQDPEKLKGLYKSFLSLKPAKKILLLKKDELLAFRNALLFPEKVAKILDLKPEEYYAASLFMKSALKISGSQYEGKNAAEMIYSRYRKKFFQNGEIRAKHLLLMENKPVCSLKRPAKNIFEVLLSHSFYFSIENQNTPKLIEKAIAQLLNTPLIKPILQALAHIFYTEKGGIYFAERPTTEIFGEKHLSGFYRHKRRSIFIGGITKETFTYFKGIIIHEAMHLLICRLFDKRCDPVKSVSDAKRWNEGLAQDYQIREKIKPLTFDESQIKKILLIEQHPFYFPSGFDGNNKNHLKTLREEAAVRFWQLISMGVSLDALKRLAPHLWTLSMEEISPKIDQLSHAFSLSNLPTIDQIEAALPLTYLKPKRSCEVFPASFLLKMCGGLRV